MLTIFRILLAPLAALLLLGAVACGGDDDDDDDSGGDATATVTASAEETSDGDDGEGDDGGDDDGGDDSGDSADLESYFADMAEIAARTDDRLTEIGDRLQNATYTSDTEEIADVQAGLQESGETLETALLDVSDVDAPDETTEAHEAFVDRLQEVLVLQSQLTQDLAEVTTGAELDDLVNSYSADLNQADAAFDDACFALQAIADENFIEADLRCG